MLIKLSQRMALSCFSPSGAPTDTCVGKPKRSEKMGAQITVEKLESTSG